MRPLYFAKYNLNTLAQHLNITVAFITKENQQSLVFVFCGVLGFFFFARIRVLIDIIIAQSLNMMGIMTLVFFSTLLFILHLYVSYALKSTESVIFKLIM